MCVHVLLYRNDGPIAMMAPSRKTPANCITAMPDKSAGDVVDRFCNTLLGPVLDTVGINLEREQVRQLTRHFALLLQWNQRINLTSVWKPEQIATRHYGESLFLASKITDMKGEVVDIGSGGGFPGIPIAIVNPQVQVTLVESVGKKAVFLKEVARDLQNVRIFQGRFEDISRHFDWATVRGVNLSRLIRAIASQADNVAIITSAEKAGRLARNQLFKWQQPIPTPWGTGRVLLVGSQKEDTKPHPSDSQASEGPTPVSGKAKRQGFTWNPFLPGPDPYTRSSLSKDLFHRPIRGRADG